MFSFLLPVSIIHTILPFRLSHPHLALIPFLSSWSFRFLSLFSTLSHAFFSILPRTLIPSQMLITENGNYPSSFLQAASLDTLCEIHIFETVLLPIIFFTITHCYLRLISSSPKERKMEEGKRCRTDEDDITETCENNYGGTYSIHFITITHINAFLL